MSREIDYTGAPEDYVGKLTHSFPTRPVPITVTARESVSGAGFASGRLVEWRASADNPDYVRWDDVQGSFALADTPEGAVANLRLMRPDWFERSR